MRLHCDGRTVAYEMRSRTSLSKHNRELKQPRRQRQGKRHFKNDFQIFQTFS